MHDILGQLPDANAPSAPAVDFVYMFWFWGSVAFFAVVAILTVLFCWQYRRRPGVKAAATGHNTILELTWTFSPLILLFFFFHQGFKGYIFEATPPDNAIQIRVRASQWKWEFEQPNGMKELGQLHVPVGRPVQLIMSSEDVIHSFFIPAFRLKKDVVPGLYTTMWFQADRTNAQADQANGEYQPRDGYNDGEGYQIFCTEFCGTGHSMMLAKLIVEPLGQYQQFLAEGPPPPTDPSTGQAVTPVKWGELLRTQAGCNACHSIDGATGPGPSWRGLYGTQRRMTDGSTMTVDDNFIRQSILQPQAKVDAAFTGVVMPPYQGALSDRQVEGLIAYIKSLR